MSPAKTESSTVVVEEVTTEMTQPIIVDLGKQKASRLKDLKAGEGELWDEVLDVIEEVKEMVGADAADKVVLPIILIYEKKTPAQRIERLLFPLAGWADEDDDDLDGDDAEEDED